MLPRPASCQVLMTQADQAYTGQLSARQSIHSHSSILGSRNAAHCNFMAAADESDDQGSMVGVSQASLLPCDAAYELLKLQVVWCCGPVLGTEGAQPRSACPSG